jgi:hypothetical protein
MPIVKPEQDPFRTAEVLTLLEKHEERRQRNGNAEPLSREFAELLKRLKRCIPSRSKTSLIGPGSPAFLRWCNEQGLPQDLRDHFARCSVRGAERSFGCAVLRDEQGIIDAHKSDTQLLAAKLLNIASCPNGDLVVMDLKAKTFPIGYISHEHYWSSTPPPPREYLVRVADSLYDFLRGLDDGTLPGDYWEATRGT